MTVYQLFSEISSVLLSTEDFDVTMNTVLSLTGRYTGVSRVYIFMDDDDKSATTSNTYEWCARGVSSQIDRLQHFPWDSVRSLRRALERDGIFHSDDVNGLEPDFRAEMEREGILAIVACPILLSGRIRGFLGFDECRKRRIWKPAELDLLKAVAGMVAGSYEQRFSRQCIESERNNFETFFDTVDDILLISTLEGRIIHANRAVSEKLGYTLEELKEMQILDLHPVDKREEAARILGEMFRGERCDCPLELEAKIGTRIPVETRIWFGTWDGRDCIFGISKDLSKEQEALRKFTKLFESNPALMAITTPEGVFTDVNDALHKAFGYRREEIIGRTARELSLFVDPEIRENLAAELRATGRIRDVAVDIRCKDGRILTGLFSGEVMESQGKTFFLTVMVDVSRQKQAEQELQESENRFNLAINGTGAGLWDWDMARGTVYFSPIWKSMLGYEDREIENSVDGWKKLWHPDDAPEIEKAMADYLERRRSVFEIAHRLRHKDGQWRWILARGSIIRNADGKPCRWVGTHIDITVEKERSEELERFFSVNLDLLCIADTCGHFLKTNKAWEDILGYSSDELENRLFLDFVHPDDLQATRDAMNVLEEQREVINFVNRYHHKDGSWRYIEWKSHPYGNLIYAAARDITHRIEAEQRLERISILDPLTGIHNRRYVFERLEGILAEYLRHGKIFAVSMIDIDHFKQINDRYGHQAGDFILTEFASFIRKNLRSYDLLGRYGGEEFFIVFSNTEKREAEARLEGLLDMIREKKFVFDSVEINLTFSAGVSDCLDFTGDALTSMAIVDAADRSMYEAKRSGRNRVVAVNGIREIPASS